MSFKLRSWVGIYAHTANAVLIVGVLVYALTRGGGPQGEHLSDGSVSSHLTNLLFFAALCGLGAAATIEILKRVLGVRGMYQVRQTERWLASRSSDDKTGATSLNGLLTALGVDVYRNQVVRDQQQARLFNLPTEQLAAQISAAAELAMSYPDQHQGLLESLSGRPVAPRSPERADQDRGVGGEGASPSGSAPSDGDAADRFELAQRVRTGIDQLQIWLGDGWRRAVQSAALWMAGWYGVGLVRVLHIGDRASGVYVLAALVLGGAFAWVARDLAAFVERARR